jgi:hypothetical protein
MPAGVVELVDAGDSKSPEGNLVPVRVRPPAPSEIKGLGFLGLPRFCVEFLAGVIIGVIDSRIFLH